MGRGHFFFHIVDQRITLTEARRVGPTRFADLRRQDAGGDAWWLNWLISMVLDASIQCVAVAVRRILLIDKGMQRFFAIDTRIC
jgi:hypothetical protein